MGRPPLPIGTHGEIWFYPLPSGKVRACTNYKDYDGITRPVERVGKSKTAAATALKVALRDRGRVSSFGEITPDTKVSAVAELWLRDLDESSKARGTKEKYRRAWEKHLAEPMKGLRVRDVRVSTADGILRAIIGKHGRAQGVHAKVVLTGIFALAVRHDARESNPVRELAPARPAKAQPKIVLTEVSVAGLLAVLGSSEYAARHDLPDLVLALSGLGCRIGELLALDWSRVDFGAGTIRLEGTVVRVAGEGLVVQRHTKTKAGMRTIMPPRWVMACLRRRFEERSSECVFPSSTGTIKDPNNTRTALRKVLEGTEWAELHPHAFRHLVADRLDAAGLTARQIADYLGHSNISTTQEVYLTRKAVGPAAGEALTEIAPKDPGKQREDHVDGEANPV